MTGRTLALAGAVALLASPAVATTVNEKEFTCPVGGERFEDFVVGSYTTWGQRPDGRSYGTLSIYPIVECPGNGFLLFDEDFTLEEIARLEPLVASAEYQGMRTGETPHYRAWWLMNRLGREPLAQTSALLRASWESDDDPGRKARYQTAFVGAAEALARTDENAESWFWYSLRAANAQRELGRFDEAAALLDRIDRPDLRPIDPDRLEGAHRLIAGLRSLIAERNPVSEPTNLVPAEIAAVRCVVHRESLSQSEQAACASADVRKAISSSTDRDRNGNALRGEAAIRHRYARADGEPR